MGWKICDSDSPCGDLIMIFSEAPLHGAYVIDIEAQEDERGFFSRVVCCKEFSQFGLNVNFVQQSISWNPRRGTLRGLHFQESPFAEDKLIRVTAGAIFDVMVDIRPQSATFGQWFGLELTEQNRRQVYIPKGFAHGFLTLTDDVEVQYKVDEYYSPENDRSIRYDDPEIGVDWGIEDPILSEKDLNAPLLKDSNINFKY